MLRLCWMCMCRLQLLRRGGVFRAPAQKQQQQKNRKDTPECRKSLFAPLAAQFSELETFRKLLD